MPTAEHAPPPPSPRAPHRWRKCAARVWWWFVPGMIATVVLGVACARWAPFNTSFFQMNTWPGGIMTALGWSHAGPLRGWRRRDSFFYLGQFRTLHDWETPGPTPEWLTALHLPPFDQQYPAYESMRSTSHDGLPLPWLMRTMSIVEGDTGGRWDIHTRSSHYFVTLTGTAIPHPGLALPPGARPPSRFVFRYLTYFPDPFGFLLNAAFFSTLWMPVTAWHRRRKRGKGNCVRCNYSRAGLAPDAVCPECGHKPVHSR